MTSSLPSGLVVAPDPCSPSAPRRVSWLLALFGALSPSLAAQGEHPSPSAEAGDWIRGSYLTADCPPFVFLTQPLASIGFGADVVEQFNLGDPGRQLMFMDHSLSAPVLLFPRPAHKERNLINSPSLGAGSVHEPSVYQDLEHGQFWVFFSYANDVSNPDISKPCEIFAINLTAAVLNPVSFDPNALPVSRVTTSPTTVSEMLERSFNPTWSARGFWNQGIGKHPAINQSACVVDEEHGPVLYHATNERRAGSFGLHAGDLEFTPSTVSLVNSRPIQHFGTTSMIGFFESPGGCAGSYESSVESPGQWSIFEFGSDEALATTLSGYGNGPNVADHGGTTIMSAQVPNTSHVVLTRYYVNNNQGFGSLLILPYEKRGLNSDNRGGALEQAGLWNLFPEIDPDQDRPSYVGKFGMPAAGRINPVLRGGEPLSSAEDSEGPASLRGVELFATYSAGCSNLRTPACAVPFHLTLVAINDLSKPIYAKGGFSAENSTSFDNPAYGPRERVFPVLKHPDQHCFGMKPIIGHFERFGWQHRSVAPLPGGSRAAGAHYPSLAGLPVAQVTAGPIYRTDVRAYGRRGSPYDPTTAVRNGSKNRVELITACLTKDMDPEDLEARDIAGMRVFVTDPRVQRHYYGGLRRIHAKSGWGYLHHDGAGNPGNDSDAEERERVRLLSDVPVEPDGSISFLLPANVPVRFQLIHKDGTVLAAHRNHHSFAPGQVEKRCAGCHNHQQDTISSPAALTAFQPGYKPFDTLTSTGKFDWDASGELTFSVAPKPTLPVPEFKADIWPLMKAECASCHDSERNPSGIGLAGFDMSMPIAEAVPKATAPVDQATAIWSYLHNYRYINRVVGAAKSPFAWYFTGVASDDAVRLDGETNSEYRPRPGSRYWITTDHGGQNPHRGIQSKTAAYKVIEWIDAGAPIDHDMVDAEGRVINGGGVNYDGYQIGLKVHLGEASGSRTLTVGYWDVDSNVKDIDVFVDDRLYQHHSLPGGSNGRVMTPLPYGLRDEAQILVRATDANDNRSHVEKSVLQLLLEAEPLRGDYRLGVGEVQIGAAAAQVGSLAVLVVAADASHAGEPFLLAGSASGYYPGFRLFGSLGLANTLNPDPLLLATLNRGVVGALDGSGRATVTFAVPPALFVGGQEMFWQALALGSSALGESNLAVLKISSQSAGGQ